MWYNILIGCEVQFLADPSPTLFWAETVTEYHSEFAPARSLYV